VRTKHREWLQLGLFLERYHKDCDEFLDHIVQVTGDETWVSFVNAETNEQSKQWMHMHSPKKLTKFSQTLSTSKLRDQNRFLRQERGADGGIHAIRDHNNVTSVLRKTKKNCVGPFRTKGVDCWHPVQCSSMTMRFRMQLLALEHCWSISTGSCLTNLLTALISLRVTITCLPT
jgi:hypothetical protein